MSEVISDAEKKHLVHVARWITATYGIKAVKNMAANLPAYLDAYNEAYADFVAKMQKSQELRDLAAAQVYTSIRKEG